MGFCDAADSRLSRLPWCPRFSSEKTSRIVEHRLMCRGVTSGLKTVFGRLSKSDVSVYLTERYAFRDAVNSAKQGGVFHESAVRAFFCPGR
jgi:hypothetical protein